MSNKNKKVKDRKRPEKIGKVEEIIDEFMKSICDLPLEEQLDTLIMKYSVTLKETQTLTDSVRSLESKLSNCDKEKEKLLSDTTKRFLAQSRLEGVCRELQRQNKLLKDENLQKIREEEEKRREVSNKFQAALNEVTAIMHDNSEKNLKLRDDNIEMTNKFHKICEQFKEKEEDFSRLKKQLKLEKQLADATVQKVQCELSAEREIWKREKEHIEKQLKSSEEERAKLEINLQSLQISLNTYNDKYEEFETTISRSNKIFSDYKSEMGKMSKQVNKLEDDCLTWKRKWEQAANMIINLKNEKHISDNEKVQLEKKLNQLSNLCRSLQEERTFYINQLRVHGIEPESSKGKAGNIETAPHSNTTNNSTNCSHTESNDTQTETVVAENKTDQSTELEAINEVADNAIEAVLQDQVQMDNNVPLIENEIVSNQNSDEKVKMKNNRKKKDKK